MLIDMEVTVDRGAAAALRLVRRARVARLAHSPHQRDADGAVAGAVVALVGGVCGSGAAQCAAVKLATGDLKERRSLALANIEFAKADAHLQALTYRSMHR